MVNKVKLIDGYRVVQLSFDFLEDLWDKANGNQEAIFGTTQYSEYMDMMFKSLTVASEDNKIVLIARPLRPPYALVHGIFFDRRVFSEETKNEIKWVIKWLKSRYDLRCVECRISKKAKALSRLLNDLGYVKIQGTEGEWGGNILETYRHMEVNHG